MLSPQEWISWGGSLVVAAIGGITSTFWWAMKRHIARVDEHAARIAALEHGKVGRDELEAAITRMEATAQRNTEQTNTRLDRIYELLATAARAPV